MLEFIYDYESNDHIAYKVLDKTNNTLHMGFCIDITSVIDYIYIPYSSLIFLDTKSSDFIIMFINEIYNLYFGFKLLDLCSPERGRCVAWHAQTTARRKADRADCGAVGQAGALVLL